ncbi:ArsC/Spx/MgsR family protein [Arenibacter palladensis]|uniref:arsenate reductase family protein n=1 Tax=Arenibacter palladensis TaxID=237373 RepID=UPI002FD6495E
MSVLARNENQITFIYSSLSNLGKQLLGYLEGAKKNVECIDIAQEKINDTIWLEVIENLGLPFREVFMDIDQHLPDLNGKENFATDDWLKIINNNPVLLQRPIVINGDKAKLLSNRSEILHFFGVDSAGLKKRMAHEPPTTTSMTDEESFI